MKILTYLAFIFLGFQGPHAHSATPTAGQINMSKKIDLAIEWSKHLQDEVKKGKQYSAKEIEADLTGITSLLLAAGLTANQIILESPAEKIEGHFTEMRRYQEAANQSAKDFPMAKAGKNPNFSKMKAAAKNILGNLENAKHWHELELSEIEKNPKD